MKTKEITFEDNKYLIKGMGFFKSNRLFLDKIKPLFPVLLSAAKKRHEAKDDQSKLSDMLTEVLESVDGDLVEHITKNILYDVQVKKQDKDFEKLDLDELDYELLIELLKAAFSLNYSSLGKLMTRMKQMSEEVPSPINE